jgi:hypothetical protein
LRFLLPFQVLLWGQLLKIWLYQAGFLVESCLGISHGRTFEAENKVGILIIHSHSIIHIRITSSQTVYHSQHLSSIIFYAICFSRVSHNNFFLRDIYWEFRTHCNKDRTRHFANFRVASWKLACEKLAILQARFRCFYSKSFSCHQSCPPKPVFWTWHLCKSLANVPGNTTPPIKNLS